MIDKNENKILNIIRYAPPFFIIVVTFIVAMFLTIEHNKKIQEEKRLIKSQFLKGERTRIKNITKRTFHFLEEKEKTTTSELKETIKLHVNNAYEVVESLYWQLKDKKSKQELETIIREALRDIRFLDGRGYLFIFELTGKNILNSGFPQIEGKELWNYKDAKGTLLIQEMNQLLKTKEEVFYDWYWKKPGDNKTQYKKVGFFKKFEPLGWFIGTGEYIEDFKDEIKKEALRHISKQRFINEGYVFIIDKNGTLVSTFYKDMQGLNHYKENSLKSFSDEIKRFSKEQKGEDFIQYKVVNSPDEILGREKISYIISFDKWDWIVGSGFYIDKVNEAIQSRFKELEEKYDNYINKLIITNLLILIILLILSFLISRYIEKIFSKYKFNLKKKSETLLKAQHVAKIGDWELDLKTMEANWSPAVLDILEIKTKPKKVGPEFLKTIMYKEDWTCFENSMKNALENGVEHRCSYRVKTQKGYKWLDCRGQLNEDRTKIIGTLQDITDLKKIQFEKEQKEKLLYQQSKMAAMGEMIGNIAHQWRQPLSAISISATGVKLQKQMGIISDKEVIDIMDSINNSAQYLSQTIEDFRTFFDSKEGKRVECQLSSIINKALKLIEASLNSHGIEVIKDIEDTNITILENELIQVMVNILNNSKDALVELDSSIHKRIIFIKSYKKENTLSIEILDNANGIEPKILDRVFEPYFTTKHKSQGTGIGLYMSHDIVTKLLGGKIRLKNKKYTFRKKIYKGVSCIINIEN